MDMRLFRAGLPEGVGQELALQNGIWKDGVEEGECQEGEQFRCNSRETEGMQVFLEHQNSLRMVKDRCGAIDYLNEIDFICYCSINNSFIDLYQFWIYEEGGFSVGLGWVGHRPRKQIAFFNLSSKL